MHAIAWTDWALDPDVVYLDHGSYGACPRPVLAAQARLRERLERGPARFFAEELPPLRDAARAALAAFVRADPRDLAFLPNATAGLNAVLRSLSFVTGDEILITDHAYPACRNAVAYVGAMGGARPVVAHVAFPLRRAADVVDALLARVGPRTRLAIVDHVTSPTGLVFPVAELAAALRARSVAVLVDGAHAPGMVPLDLGSLGADYYVGTCHKWLCTPKGAAFLWVARPLQDRVHPVSISHGYAVPPGDRAPFQLEFDWTGTHDPTPYLCLPEALRFLDALAPGGVSALMAANRELALQGRRELCDALGCLPPAPDDMIAALAALPVREARDDEYGEDLAQDPLHRALLERGLDVNVAAWPRWPRRVLRVSVQAYNELDDYRRLAHNLRGLAMGAG
jgi:isopenicillin-N epimerase